MRRLPSYAFPRRRHSVVEFANRAALVTRAVSVLMIFVSERLLIVSNVNKYGEDDDNNNQHSNRLAGKFVDALLVTGFARQEALV